MRFREFLEAQLPPKIKPFSIEELRARARQAFKEKMGRDPVSDDELRNWSSEELKRMRSETEHYRASSGEQKLNKNNDGGPPINGVSNNRYWQ